MQRDIVYELYTQCRHQDCTIQAELDGEAVTIEFEKDTVICKIGCTHFRRHGSILFDTISENYYTIDTSDGSPKLLLVIARKGDIVIEGAIKKIR